MFAAHFVEMIQTVAVMTSGVFDEGLQSDAVACVALQPTAQMAYSVLFSMQAAVCVSLVVRKARAKFVRPTVTVAAGSVPRDAALPHVSPALARPMSAVWHCILNRFVHPSAPRTSVLLVDGVKTVHQVFVEAANAPSHAQPVLVRTTECASKTNFSIYVNGAVRRALIVRPMPSVEIPDNIDSVQPAVC